MAEVLSASFGNDHDTSTRPGRFVDIMRMARRIVSEYTFVTEGDTVAIVCDHEVSPMIVDGLAGQVYSVGATPVVIRITTQDVHGGEPPKPVAAALRSADLVYAVVSKSITHTSAVQQARASGVRYLGLSNITEDAFIRGAATGDPRVIAEIGEKARSVLRNSTKVRVTSDAGTDVTFSVSGRRVDVDGFMVPREPGAGAMFPSGEINMCPVEDSVEGKIVIDHWVQGIGLLHEPMTWDFRDGVCEKIAGGYQAEQLVRLIDDQGDKYSRRCGEFAIGINPAARVGGNPHREGKKILGSCHFALGTGKALGGVFQSTLHLDGLILRPVIEVDGKTIFDRGRFQL